MHHFSIVITLSASNGFLCILPNNRFIGKSQKHLHKSLFCRCNKSRIFIPKVFNRSHILWSYSKDTFTALDIVDNFVENDKRAIAIFLPSIDSTNT